jgi:hypothetical protein
VVPQSRWGVKRTRDCVRSEGGEQNDEWLVAGHRYMSEISLRKLFIQPKEEIPAHLEAKTA